MGLLILAATRVHAAPVGNLADGRGAGLEGRPSDGNGGEPTAESSEDGGGASDGDEESLAEDTELDGERDGDLDGERDATGLTARERGEDVDEMAEPDRLADLVEDAAVDDPLLRDAIETGIVFSTAFAEATEVGDLAARHQRPSRLGRLDLAVAWRRGYRVMPIGFALDGPHVTQRDSTIYERRIDDTVLVLVTWRI